MSDESPVSCSKCSTVWQNRGTTNCWSGDGATAYGKIVDQIGTLPLGDPQIPGLVTQAYKYVFDETPVIPLVQAEKLVPFDTTYWTNWPTSDNNYNHPATWWNSTHQIILNLHKATPSS